MPPLKGMQENVCLARQAGDTARWFGRGVFGRAAQPEGGSEPAFGAG